MGGYFACRGELCSPVMVYQQFYRLTNNFSYQKQILNLWFNHNFSGRPMVAPTNEFAFQMNESQKTIHQINVN